MKYVKHQQSLCQGWMKKVFGVVFLYLGSFDGLFLFGFCPASRRVPDFVRRRLQRGHTVTATHIKGCGPAQKG